MTASDPVAAFRGQLREAANDTLPATVEDSITERLVDAVEPVVRQIVAAAVSERDAAVLAALNAGPGEDPITAARFTRGAADAFAARAARLAERHAAIRAEVNRLRATERRVRALHVFEDGLCRECIRGAVLSECNTLAALDGDPAPSPGGLPVHTLDTDRGDR